MTVSCYHTFMKKGPWVVHLTLDLDWGMGHITVAVRHERVPRCITWIIFIILIVGMATIDFSLAQAQLLIESDGSWLSDRYFTVPLTSPSVMVPPLYKERKDLEWCRYSSSSTGTTREMAEIMHPRDVCQSTMVITQKRRHPVNKALPNASMHEGGGHLW